MDTLCWLFLIILGTFHSNIDAVYYDDARSVRNILNTLDHNIRPLETMEVRIGFSLLSITRLLSDENKLCAVGWFTVVWEDSLLSWGAATYPITSLHYAEGEIWRPELRIENSVSDVDIITNQHHKFRVLMNGTVTWEPARQMEAHCTQDLTFYPFDKQKCHITLTSWSHDVSEVVLKALRTNVDLTFFEENAEWILDRETEVVLNNLTTTSGGLAIVNSRITFYFTMSRISRLVGLTVLFPLIMLSILSLLVFILPIESGEKVNYAAVIFLSIIVYYTSAVGYFPVSKTVPVRVTYIMVVLGLSCLSVFCTFIVLWLHHQRADRRMSYLVVNIYTFLCKITCTGTENDGTLDTKTPESIPEHSTTMEHPKQLTPIQNGGSHLTTAPRDTLEKLPPVNDHLRRNKVRPKSGESVYSVKKQKVVHWREPNNWQHLALSLNRLFLVLFSVMTILLHFIFLITLAVGGNA